MNKEITLTELLGDIEFYPDKNLKLYATVYLDKLNLISDILIGQQEEIQHLKSIIKEVREYIEQVKILSTSGLIPMSESCAGEHILEILDKENK